MPHLACIPRPARLETKEPIDSGRTVTTLKEGDMNEERKEHKMRMRHSSLTGALWFGGWLFTMAFAKLLWWQCIVGLVIWPYYLGQLAR